MIRRPPRSTRTDTLFPYTTLFRSEMQVIDNEGHPDGKIPSHRAGSLYDITVPPLRAAHPVGQWNHARLRVEHGRIRQWLNGTLTADVPFGNDAWRKRVAASKFASMPLFGTFPSGVNIGRAHV